MQDHWSISGIADRSYQQEAFMPTQYDPGVLETFAAFFITRQMDGH